MKLKGKRIIITGGTAGIGEALVAALAAENRLLVIGRDPRKLQELRKRHENVDTRTCDLSSREALRELEQQAFSVFDGVDVLINNAAIQQVASIVDEEGLDLDRQDRELTLNLLAPALLCRCAGRDIIRSGRRGVILNVGSALALAPKAGSPLYCASKAGLRTLSRSIGYQLKKRGVKVLHAMLPLVETGMTAGRGRGKILAAEAAQELIEVIEEEREDASIGKAKLLSFVFRLSPRLAYRILRDS